MRAAWFWLTILLAGCPKGEESLRKANVLFKNGELEQAAALYQKATEADPERVVAWEGRGNVAFEQKKYVQAIAHYQKALSIDEKALSVRHHLAVTLATSDRRPEAIAVLEATVAMAPDDAFAHHALGGLYKKAGALEKSKKSQLSALAAQPDLYAARFALGNVLVDLSELEAADREYARLFGDGQKDLATYGHARIAAKRGQWEEAAKQLGLVLDMGAAHPEKILDDPVFGEGWSEASMRAIRERLPR